ncbi:phosphate/phosphite/phosphonate ABC transporter substrate-binding protein [Endothiovibrio diazotrophicus]
MKFLVQILAAAALAACTLGARGGTEYQFGVVPQFEPRHLAAIWVPILEELERRTGFDFVMSGSPRIPDFERDFRRGRFDFAYMNPYHSLVAAETQGYEPLVRDGGRSLYGILVVPKESPIHTLAELQGRTVAFPAPNALGASLLIRADLEQLHGVAVEPLYVKTHSSVYTNVLLGRAAAGGGVMSTLRQQKPEVRDALRVLYKTREMAPHPVVAHPRVPAADRQAVRRAFLDMAATEAGAALLAKVPIKQLIAADADDYRPLTAWGLERYFVEAP